MNKKIKCGRCGKDFLSKQIKVYVIKEYKCPTCHTVMVSDGVKRKHYCHKCNFVFDYDDVKSLAISPVRIVATTRDRDERFNYEAQKFYIDKQLINENRLCESCRKQRKILHNKLCETFTVPNDMEKQLEALSDEEWFDVFHGQIQPKLRNLVVADNKPLNK